LTTDGNAYEAVSWPFWTLQAIWQFGGLSVQHRGLNLPAEAVAEAVAEFKAIAFEG
jgi:hypothetical protein